MVRIFALAFLVLFTLSCGEDFEPAFRINDTRVIAIKAEPPDAIPGQDVLLTPFVVSPSGTLDESEYSASWWRCPDDNADPLQDNALCSNETRTELGQASPYTDTIPDDFFPTPEEAENTDAFVENSSLLGALLGYWRVVGTRVEGNEGKIIEAFKRVVISPPVRLDLIDERFADLDPRIGPEGRYELNQNPTLNTFTIHENTLDGDEVQELKAGGTYFFVPRIDTSTLQAYFSLAIDLEGLDLTRPNILESLEETELLARFNRVLRCELPLYSWFASAGDLVNQNTLDETLLESLYVPFACPEIEGAPRSPEVRFTAPAEAGEMHIWLVMRDGRGGTDFTQRSVTVVE